MPIGLGIGLNICQRGGMPSGGVSLTAPVLTWVSDVDDNTPLFEGVFTDLLEGDVGRLQISDDVGFSSPIDATNAADAAEVLALQLDYTSGALSDIQYWARLRHERGASVSAWSNVETKTIATGAVNTVPPSIAGTEIQGYTLTVTPGTWTGSPVLTYQWQADGVDIGGATATTYVVTAANEDARADITCLEIPDATVLDAEPSNAITIFNPIDLFAGGKLGVIVDPTRIGTLWQDTGATSAVAADNDPVRRANDRSGNGWNGVATSDTRRPLYNTTAHAQGALEYVSTDSLDFTATAASIFQNAAYGTIIAFANPTVTGVTQSIFFASRNATGAARLGLVIDASNKLQVQSRRLDADSAQTKSSTASVTAADHVLTVEADWANTTHQVSIDLAAAESAVPTWGAGAATSNTASSEVLSGANNTGANNPVVGDVGRIIAINAQLSAGNLVLAKKWCGKGGGMSL